MRRDASALLGRTFDLLVIGAGIQGACIAWDACLRGLAVALIDRGDFGAATSANSLGIVHGGLRYLARGDFPRMLESIRERSTLLRIAPDFVEPLAVLIPSYSGISSNAASLRAALLLNDVVSAHRNRGLRLDRSIPRGRLVSRDECLRRFPWFDSSGLTGGALWYDGQLRHPERLTVQFVRSAAERGLVPANYMRADRILIGEGKAQGALVTDLTRGAQFPVKARSVVVAAGPWTPGLVAETLGHQVPGTSVGRALAVNIQLDRLLSSVAVGAKARTGPDEDPVCGGGRFLFAAPRGGKTVLGTWYSVAGGSLATPEQGVRSLLREFNQACPGLELSPRDVLGYQCGWLPLKAGSERGRATALAERPRIINHEVPHRIRHLLSVEAVKYTTARSVAQLVVDRIFDDRGQAIPPCRTAEVPLEGMAEGKLAGADGTLSRSEIQRAVQQEMAIKLSDIIFRRSSVGVAVRLDRSLVAKVAQIAGAELGWSTMQQEAEIEEIMQGVPLRAAEPVG